MEKMILWEIKTYPSLNYIGSQIVKGFGDGEAFEVRLRDLRNPLSECDSIERKPHVTVLEEIC